MARWRSAVILLEDRGADDKHVALIERIRAGRLYYVFPGGGLEASETPEQAAVREAKEELGVDVRLGLQVARVFYHGNRQHFYRATITGGKFGSGAGPEMGADAASLSGSFTPVWVPVRELANMTVYPRAVAELVLRSLESGWPKRTVQIVEE